MQATRVKTETARYHQGMHAPLRRAVRRDGKDMHALRCMASRAGREKSWAEIAGQSSLVDTRAWRTSIVVFLTYKSNFRSRHSEAICA